MLIPFLIACTMSGFLASPGPFPTPVAPRIAADIADIPMKPPSGWKAKTAQGATVMTPGDLAEGKVYTVLVTPLQTKAGSLDEVYEIGKKTIGEAGAYTPLSKPARAQSEGGWDYELTIGMLEKGDKALLAQVLALKKGDIGGIVILIADSIETMQTYSDPFSNMIRSLGGSGKHPPAPEIAPASGTVDLQYKVPAGWVETKKQGATVIEATKDDFYTKYRWTLVVMPSQPLHGSLRENFKDYWKALITANYESDAVPLPLFVRLSDGYACAFDADSGAKHKVSGARPRIVSVYLVAHGDRFVPILAILYGYEKQLDIDMDRFLTTATIPKSSSAKIPLFSNAEVVGDWSEGSTSIASYVTASGAYAGDASIYSASSFHLNPNGTYKHLMVGIQGSTHIKEQNEGKWRVEDNELVLTHAKGVDRYSLLGCGSDPKAGRFLVIGTYSNAKAKLSFSNPRGPFQASWYKAK
ncbi:MAG: hypothetical protein JWL77_4649 [Chthonomonadaceae bacterium]|nr:hypothetical protein [Chthonomonadaceae bacterium]